MISRLYHGWRRYLKGERTTAAIRKYDKNHLCLGPRLHGRSLRYPEVLRAAGKYLDVIATNYIIPPFSVSRIV